MLLKTRFYFTSLLLALFLCLFAGDIFAATKIVARVGSVPITEFELNQIVKKLIPLNSSFHSGVSSEKINELLEQAFSEMVERAFMTQYAISNDIEINQKAVDADLDRIRSSFKSQSDFEKALGALTESELRSAIQRKLLADKALEVAVNNKIEITEESINAYYVENKHRFLKPAEFRASQIFLKVDPSSSQKDVDIIKNKAEELYDKALKGEDFYNLAYFNSDDRTKFVGGDMGYFHRGRIAEEVQTALDTMKVGEIKGPIKSLYGFHVVKLTDKKKERQLSYEEMRPKLEKTEYDLQFGKMKANWLDELRKTYKVERYN